MTQHVILRREDADMIARIIASAITAQEAVPSSGSISIRPPHQAPDKQFIGELEIHDRFKFGEKSLTNLTGLKPELANVFALALRITEQDFVLYETLRSQSRQEQMVANGTSRTRKSKHLKQADGFAWAGDLVPWIDGAAKWDWDGCAKIAYAVDCAATHLGHAERIRWGGAWDRTLADFGGTLAAYMAEVEGYKTRHAGKDFIDGPHFEWVG